MSISSINVQALSALRSSGKGVVLIDVTPGEVFAARHIPGAFNACVYEMDFLNQVTTAFPDRSTPVAVYGSHVRSLASRTAAEKLHRAGYDAVYDFREGLEGWHAAGRDIAEAEPHPEIPSPGSGPFVIDLHKSRLGWTGRNLANHHHGFVAFSEGQLLLEKDRVREGRLVLDMTRITCDDLDDSAMNQMLIRHLASDDFFDVERYPLARVTVTESRLLSDRTPGCPNLEMGCALTLKGVTESFSCTAVSGFQADGTWVAQAHFDLDRTRWNVLYGSGKFFDHLGMHLVNDLVSFQLALFATHA